MSELRLIETRELALDDIVVEDRLRPVDEMGVSAILMTIREGGATTDPIDVRRVRRKGVVSFRLIDGAHRMAAERQLGNTTILASIHEGTDADARLMEIERNLARAEMKPVDRAVFLLEYKHAYEKKYPEARAAIGQALIAKRWDTTGTIPVVSFAAKIGAMTGQDESTVRRQIRAVKALERPEIDALRSSPKWVCYNDIAEIGKITEVDERRFAVNALAAGEAKTVNAARKLYRAARGEGPAPMSDKDAKFLRLMDAWDRAGPVAQRRFLSERGTDVSERLAEVLRRGDQG
ncbi:chromosome partitioning protein, ParB family [Roseovarius azorensis]|uniref:Chromosome partitioning protein, ParB family n=1 Tax=Roseovarius azorensis TaxID=1287727 RepID=A0A1H7G567_9RHOB|nr:ParB/RepB/Spo0J family partition protein [Roseovarius azorensis]SEK33214.1 chromosome partitioning protein, ParB family [Roseovarius azorensis]